MAIALTKQALADSLRALMREHTFDKITVDEICSLANVSRRNFYRHFQDKYELLTWIFHVNYFSKIVYHDDWVSWDYFPGVCEYCYEDRDFFKNAIQVDGQNSVREYWREFLRPLLIRDFEGTFLTDVSAEFYVAYITDILFDYMYEWIKKSDCMPPREFAAFVRKSLELHSKRSYEISSRPQRSEEDSAE